MTEVSRRRKDMEGLKWQYVARMAVCGWNGGVWLEWRCMAGTADFRLFIPPKNCDAPRDVIVEVEKLKK